MTFVCLLLSICLLSVTPSCAKLCRDRHICLFNPGPIHQPQKIPGLFCSAIARVLTNKLTLCLGFEKNLLSTVMFPLLCCYNRLKLCPVFFLLCYAFCFFDLLLLCCWLHVSSNISPVWTYAFISYAWLIQQDVEWDFSCGLRARI